MILQALNDLFDRLAAAETEGFPIQGFSRQKIHFCLVLDRDGNPMGVEDLRTMKGKKPLPRELIVPERVVRSSGIAANFLSDNTGYVLGVENKGKADKARNKFEAFVDLHKRIGVDLGDEGMIALLRFLEKWSPEEPIKLPYWDELLGADLVIRLDGEGRYLHERPIVKKAWLDYRSMQENASLGMCLVTGEEGPIEPIHAKIKGVAGAQSVGASIVSFNCKAFESYGKTQNLNAPVGRKAAFSYCTALNWILSGAGRQKATIGDTTVVFWAEKKSEAEDALAAFFGLSAEQAAVENGQDEAAVKDLGIILEAARKGRIQSGIEEPDTKFYILGISPNAARLSIRFWHVSTTTGILSGLREHFDRMRIVKAFDNDPDYPSVPRLLKETAVQGKSDNIAPLLTGSLLRSVLSGSEYPRNLLTALLSRIRADGIVNTLRAGLIKAILIRNHGQMEVTVTLNKEFSNMGYRLGRLFAVLEHVQKQANPGINSTIRDKYFASAAATPQKVFPVLLTTAQQHLSKIRRQDEQRTAEFLDRKLQEIAVGFDAAPLPAYLNAESQGLFAIGYYHQRQDLYTKKTDRKEEE